jgi:hypothetical protein
MSKLQTLLFELAPADLRDTLVRTLKTAVFFAATAFIANGSDVTNLTAVKAAALTGILAGVNFLTNEALRWAKPSV